MIYETARGLSHKILHDAIEEAKKNPIPKAKPISATARVIPSEISDLIDRSCHSDEVKGLFRQLLTKMIGVEKEAAPTVREPEAVCIKIGYKVGMAVVPLENPNDHNYEIGKPVLIISIDGDNDAKALRSNGSIGNFLPRDSRNPHAVRLATNEEIEAYYDQIAASSHQTILLVA